MPGLLFEAVASLQNAASKFLSAHGFDSMDDANPHVVSEFACEIDGSCQEVLAKTYGCCCFDNIQTFNPKRKVQYCKTHKQKCAVRKVSLKQRRISAD